MSEIKINGITYTGREIITADPYGLEVLSHEYDTQDDRERDDMYREIESMNIDDDDLADEHRDDGYVGADIQLTYRVTDSGTDIIVDWETSKYHRDMRGN